MPKAADQSIIIHQIPTNSVSMRAGAFMELESAISAGRASCRSTASSRARGNRRTDGRVRAGDHAVNQVLALAQSLEERRLASGSSRSTRRAKGRSLPGSMRTPTSSWSSRIWTTGLR
jgi:hypothetical protein